VLGFLGVTHDLVNVRAVGAFQKDDVRPPLAQVRCDLEKLVLVLGVHAGFISQAAKLAGKIALVGVDFQMQRREKEEELLKDY
jgi:hypothetical protein